ncbi:molybdenum cofactor biosynthesis protein MoaE [Lichenicoccus sp.]|uniref:molybdenum cofactor biosynthesis protein MoaE n=1 Tax=Lichenicoccus sp. TaxID=2781899 RepID=UPI003D0A9662
MTIRIAVGEAPFDVGAEMAAIQQPGVGGIGCFVGVVRGRVAHGGSGLLALRLEHYPAMTERAIERIAHSAVARFGLLGCTVIHRTGTLVVGAPIVLVLSAAAHRQAALDGTEFLIDWLKTQAPFWKCEMFEDGTKAWVEARADDEAAVARWS